MGGCGRRTKGGPWMDQEQRGRDRALRHYCDKANVKILAALISGFIMIISHSSFVLAFVLKQRTKVKLVSVVALKQRDLGVGDSQDEDMF